MYVDLKLLRLENDEMHQSRLAEILGITQSSLSRMERQFSELNGLQYKKLCDYFGEEEVQKYVKENPLKNAMSLPGKRRKFRPSDLEGSVTPPEENLPKREYSLEEVFAMIAEANKTLSRTVEAQQTTIEEMRSKIDELNESLAYYRQTDKQ